MTQAPTSQGGPAVETTPAGAQQSAASSDVGSLLEAAAGQDYQSYQGAGSSPATTPQEGLDGHDDDEDLLPPEDDDDEDAEDEDGDDDDVEGETQEADGDAASAVLPMQGADPQVVDKWVSAVLKKPALLFSNVPRKYQETIYNQSLAYVQSATAEEMVQALKPQIADLQRTAFAAGVARGRSSIEEAHTDGELAAIRDTDAEEWARISKEEPARVQGFLDRERLAKDPANTYHVRAAEIRAGLDEYAMEWLKEQAKAEPGRYAPTAQGLANLEKDQVEARVVSREARKRAQAQDPDHRVAARRERSQRRRENNGMATQPASGGNGGNPPRALPTDRAELFSMAIADEVAATKARR